jgi:hypothetical protein
MTYCLLWVTTRYIIPYKCDSLQNVKQQPEGTLESRNSDTFALGFVAIAGGFIWLLVWVAHLLTHGPGPEDHKEFFLNLTWLDYSKFMVVPVFLFGWCLVALHRRQRQEAGWLGKVGLGVTLVGLVLLEVGLVADRWTIPWSTYADSSAAVWPDGRFVTGLIMSLATIPIVVGSFLFAFAIAKARVWPRLLGIPLAIGALTIFPWLHETVPGVLYGISWLLVGLAVLMLGTTGEVKSLWLLVASVVIAAVGIILMFFV